MSLNGAHNVVCFTSQFQSVIYRPTDQTESHRSTSFFVRYVHSLLSNNLPTGCLERGNKVTNDCDCVLSSQGSDLAELRIVIQDEPDSRAKKRRDIRSTARGVFRLAETVPDTWQGSGEEGTNLRVGVVLHAEGSTRFERGENLRET